LLSIVALSLVLTVVAASAAAWQIRTYEVDLGPGQADAALVLGAAVWGDRPSPVFQERIDHAIRLYEQGAVDCIIFTGGQGDEGEPAEAMVARQIALQRGIPSADILTETESWTTWQNLYHAHQVALERGLEHFLIVSDPLHMKRAVLMTRDLGMDAYPSPTPTTMYRSWRSQLGFLARETCFYLMYLVSRPVWVAIGSLPK
jgi:uncharacterized SAM-binding protein YcdF (DUF218 family)